MPIKAIAVDPKNPAAFIEISPEKPRRASTICWWK